MNGKIMIGAAVLLLVWGIAALLYGETVVGGALVVVGIGLLGTGMRLAKKKDAEP